MQHLKGFNEAGMYFKVDSVVGRLSSPFNNPHSLQLRRTGGYTRGSWAKD